MEEETMITVTLTKRDYEKLQWIIENSQHLQKCLELSMALYASQYQKELTSS